jgi:carbonic anhydrase
LDLTEFVNKINSNKRWTYQGSLTTAPCDEGILWNVVENVIPIRQSTLNKYTEMRKVAEDQVMNKIADTAPETLAFLEELKEDIPDA